MKKIINAILLIVLTVIIFIILVIISNVLLENIVLPSDYLFYEHRPIYSNLIAPLLTVPSLFVSYYIIYYVKKKISLVEDDYYYFVRFVKKLKRWNIIIMTVWILAVYVSFTSLTYVTNDRIVVVSPLNLKGQGYNYSNVEEIETGFGDKKFSIFEHEKEGNFYYRITIDGRTTIFHMPSANSDVVRYEDTFLELEEFDEALRKYNIPKESNSDGYDKCYLEQRYIDRFLRIINSE